jgi:DNA-binding MarR family transcriptional regulator
MSEPDDFKLNESIGYLISIAGLRYKGEVWRRLKPFDVTPEQWVVLNGLSTEQGICQRELAERIVKNHPNMTRILDKMEHKGLIRRLADVCDRRVSKVFLTEEGARVRDKLQPVMCEVYENSLKGFDAGEITVLKRLLARFTANLR